MWPQIISSSLFSCWKLMKHTNESVIRWYSSYLITNVVYATECKFIPLIKLIFVVQNCGPYNRDALYTNIWLVRTQYKIAGYNISSKLSYLRHIFFVLLDSSLKRRNYAKLQMRSAQFSLGFVSKFSKAREKEGYLWEGDMPWRKWMSQ